MKNLIILVSLLMTGCVAAPYRPVVYYPDTHIHYTERYFTPRHYRSDWYYNPYNYRHRH
jgi:hypothetical protein